MSPEVAAKYPEYDFIICGGGTAGCVVAGRLAEADASTRILVIEAGPHNRELANVHMVGGWSQNFDCETDWNIITPPMQGVGGRQVKLSRGKFLGGSSGVNGTLCIRGCKQDYDDWNLPGWSGAELFEYMKKAESFHNKPWFQATAGAHGYEGPLHTEPHDLAPISNLLLESMESQGLPLVPDMFSTGETPHGCGHAPRTHHKGIRTTGADYLTNERQRSNIEILVETNVDKVNFEQVDGRPHARSVTAILKNGSECTFRARKEIIISGGAYCTPAILMRSGIGDKAELEKHDIICISNVPGVGKNLLDHLIVFAFYETEKAGLTNDHLVYHGDGFANSAKQYQEHKSGVFSTFPFGAFAFARLDERLKDEPLWRDSKREAGRDPMDLTPKQPNIEFFTTELYGGPKHYDQFPSDNKHVFAMITELFSPRSRDCAYLTDPLDLLVLTEGCRFGNEIVMQGAGTKTIVKGSWPTESQHHRFSEREEWINFVKQEATTCYHAAGTCRMGSLDDPAAVLDAELFVRGITGLRVADCSVMPNLHGGHTQMPAYGIGEKAADMIKKSWSMV